MKKNTGFLILALLAVSSSFVGWNSFSPQNNTSAITDYYYYQNQRYYLDHKPDLVYIKLKSIISRQQFENIIAPYGTIPADFSFEKK